MEAVRLENVPTRLFLESQDHQHDLIRELQLIHIGERFDGAATGAAEQIGHLIADILARYGDVRATTRQQAQAALERGEDVITLEVPVRDGMAESLQKWLDLLEEADRLADDGQLLLVAAREELRRLRRWYVGELVSRLRA